MTNNYVEKQLSLKEAYPKFFNLFFSGRAPNAPFHSCQLGGLECAEGWLGIIADAADKIEALINQLPPEEQEYYFAVQIKEKFGTLRLYMAAQTDAMSDIIQEAEAKSAETCEVCGKPGILEQTGWWRTVCPDHSKEKV